MLIIKKSTSECKQQNIVEWVRKRERVRESVNKNKLGHKKIEKKSLFYAHFSLHASIYINRAEKEGSRSYCFWINSVDGFH